MSIESIEIVFENFESVSIKWEHIVDIIIPGQIKTKFNQELGFYEYADLIIMEIDNKANIKFFSSWDDDNPIMPTFERFMYWDTIVYIAFVNNDSMMTRSVYMPKYAKYYNEVAKRGKHYEQNRTNVILPNGNLQVRIVE
jgi:hypothetical protein